MEKEIIISAPYKGKINLDYMACINYAMILNGIRSFTRFEIINESDINEWKDVNILISGDMLEQCRLSVSILRKGQTVSFDEANLIPKTAKLMSLTEAIQTSFTITVKVGQNIILQQAIPIMLMAFDQWHGSAVMPELLASFVTPNHPCIADICKRASEYLQNKTGHGGMDDYQSQDYRRVRDQVEAVYQTLLGENITYMTVPASFESMGQRIRLADKILTDRVGNCIELSLLLCSCLESIGLQTMMLIYKGHATMGVWVNPVDNVPMVGYDKRLISENIKDTYGNLILIESTYLTEGLTFQEALEQGETYLLNHSSDFEYYVDIFEARLGNIRPLPHCILSDTGWEIHDNGSYDVLFDELAQRNRFDIHGTASSEKLKAKQKLWERKLLDLSLRNSLLNMKSGKHIVPLKPLPISEILAHLEAEQLNDDIQFPAKSEESEFSTIKELYRAARTSLEENGANTLFLSVGTLVWYEVDKDTPHFAPIMFLPLEIVRHGARKYIIRVRDEEPIMNITLLEMMRQTFELEIPDLSPVPEDENDMIDWQRVFNILNTSIAEVNEKAQEEKQWHIVEECMIGIFSFTKFVMWHDIHSNPEALEKHPLLKSFIEGRLMLNEQNQEIEVRELDKSSQPAEYAIPVDVDSSQLEAVVRSNQDSSFILYGPPGTGKSQTITNMIANALYHNKRVLFVAEKKAALEVVQERLTRIGLDPFCLELHSNKVDKKSFLSQMETALDVTKQISNAVFKQKSAELFARRKELNDYVEALHKIRKDGLSLYDYINRFLDIDGDIMPLSYKEISHLSLKQVKDVSERYEAFDVVQGILGQHPSLHPLLGLYPFENTAENQQCLTDGLENLSVAIIQSRHKEQGWINRWFLKRTAMEILQRSKEWKELMSLAELDGRISEDIDLLETTIAVWNQNADKLRLWYHFSTRAQELKAFKVPTAMAYYLHGNSGKCTANAFLKGYYQRMALNIVDTDPTLRSFNGMLFEEIIKKYRSLTREFQELTKEELVCRLSHRIPHIETADVVEKEEITFLRKRIAGHGRAYSVRRMLDQTRHILPQLCPCMLMSPLSVAQYLEMSNNQFDLVIFDEASQMPTSEAVGAIARGKNTIVVGDPKQMPPTSFFMTNSTNENDADIDDLESILDDCISMSLPGHYLNWHYRSKHESLIAFSNTHFYDGRLITFPSVDDQQRKVTLQHVDGVYDFGKTRSNKAEAKAIVDDVISRLERMLPSEADNLTTSEFQLAGLRGVTEQEPYRSIGIVAFSKVQSNLIEDMLTDALAKRPELEKLAMKNEEPIFIKNLENVQGDERDIILFSVGYGPDKKGKVSMNFGPLNQAGGERRLNVAVSRARYEMKVFSTLESYQIDLQRTNAAGVVGLKRFLEYAETGKLPCPSSQIEESNVDPITNYIASQLRQEGHEVHTNVGRSNFKVDIAIVDKDNPSCYEKGIVIDGRNYYSTPTARDREIVQPKILEQLGWNIEHRWTTDYISDITSKNSK